VKISHVLILFLAAFAPLSYGFASAQTECSQICVAKQFYREGEAVIISGKVDVFLSNTPLLIQVFRETNRVHIAQVDVSQDGTYSYSLIADGPYFKTDGKYVVQASYGVTGNVFETRFDFQTTAAGQNPSQIFEVRAGDQGTFDIPYIMKGGTIKNIIVDPAILGLVVTIQADSDGYITLDLGRQWIDAKTGANGRTGDDGKYIIHIDGQQVPYQESSTGPESRFITIQFQDGDSDIEIIGTYVVPEFGPIAILILVVAVSSVLVLSKKSAFLRFS